MARMPLANSSRPTICPKRPKPGDDHRAASLVDRVGRALRRGGPPRRQLVVQQEQQRRRRHRERDGDGQLPRRVGGEHARQLRDAEHDERELAALRQQRGEEPALPRADADDARDQPQRRAASARAARRRARAIASGALRSRPKSIVIPTEMKKRPSSSPLNGSMSVSSAWRYSELASSTPARKAPSAIEMPASVHQLRDADDQQQREGGEHLADVGAGDDAQHRARQVAADHQDAGDRRRGLRGLLPGRGSVRRPHARRAAGSPPAAEWRRCPGTAAPRTRCAPSGVGVRLRSLIVCIAIAVDDSASASPATSAACHGSPSARPPAASAAPDSAELQRAAAEHRPAHRPEALRLELEPDDEQHQHDAELGEVQDRLDVVDEPQAPGSDRDAGDQIARAPTPSPSALGERHAQHRRGQVDQRVDQHRRASVRARRSPARAMARAARASARRARQARRRRSRSRRARRAAAPSACRRSARSARSAGTKLANGCGVDAGRRVGLLVAAGRRHPQAVLAGERRPALAVGPAIGEHLVEPVLEQRRNGVPEQRVHPDDEPRLRQRPLLGGDVDVEIGVEIVERAELEVRPTPAARRPARGWSASG